MSKKQIAPQDERIQDAIYRLDDIIHDYLFNPDTAYMLGSLFKLQDDLNDALTLARVNTIKTKSKGN
jgi:hypothetical protein